MQDPFADKSSNKFHREVQMWMAVLMCLLVTFLYLAIKRMSGPDTEIPAHILQASVAHVPPIAFDRAQAVPPKPSHLSSVPSIRRGAFSTNAPTGLKLNRLGKQERLTKSDIAVSGRRISSHQFSNDSPKSTHVAALNNVPLPFPKPTFIETKNLDVAKADNKAEALGRQRAKQLAALTSGLPERLNKIQSSVKRATVELAPEAVVADNADNNSVAIIDNGFVPPSPFKSAIRSPLKPIVEPPKKFVNEEPIKASKPTPVQPAAKNSFASKPLVASPALAPIPSPTVPRLPRLPVKNSPESNTFVPLPSLRPIATPVVRKVVEPSRLPIQVEPKSKPSEIVKPLKPIPHADPSPELKQHVVQAGESFFTIAQQHYGDAQWFRALRLANQSVAGSELPVGVSLVIPTTAELARQFPEYALQAAAEQPREAEQRIYVTQTGDTLFDIARRKTGQGSRFSEIISSNELRLPAQIRASDQLPEGLRLVLPESSLQ